jgi:hypothetical protein
MSYRLWQAPFSFGTLGNDSQLRSSRRLNSSNLQWLKRLYIPRGPLERSFGSCDYRSSSLIFTAANVWRSSWDPPKHCHAPLRRNTHCDDRSINRTVSLKGIDMPIIMAIASRVSDMTKRTMTLKGSQRLFSALCSTVYHWGFMSRAFMNCSMNLALR